MSTVSVLPTLHNPILQKFISAFTVLPSVKHPRYDEDQRPLWSDTDSRVFESPSTSDTHHTISFNYLVFSSAGLSWSLLPSHSRNYFFAFKTTKKSTVWIHYTYYTFNPFAIFFPSLWKPKPHHFTSIFHLLWSLYRLKCTTVPNNNKIITVSKIYTLWAGESARRVRRLRPSLTNAVWFADPHDRRRKQLLLAAPSRNYGAHMQMCTHTQ